MQTEWRIEQMAEEIDRTAIYKNSIDEKLSSITQKYQELERKHDRVEVELKEKTRKLADTEQKLQQTEETSIEQKRWITKLTSENQLNQQKLHEIDELYQKQREAHIEELSRKNAEIRDLSTLNDETLKTAN